jgi:hypothetical protein
MENFIGPLPNIGIFRMKKHQGDSINNEAMPPYSLIPAQNGHEAVVKLLLGRVMGIEEVESDMSIATNQKLHVASGFTLSNFQLAMTKR